MPTLVLLNGPPAAGKSTLAVRFVNDRPLALNLDVDVVRGLLGDWSNQPLEAGLAARRLCLAMGESHLLAGHDVIVPQFLGRPDFIDQLDALAMRCQAHFAEVALMASRDEAVRWFAERSERPQHQGHVDAARSVALTAAVDPVGEMYDAFRRIVGARARTRFVQVTRGDVERTYSDLCAAVAG